MAVRPFFALCAVVLLATSASCGGDDEASAASATPDGADSEMTTAPTTSAGSDIEPTLVTPASRFAIHQPDLGPGYITDIGGTFELSVEDYAGTTPFGTVEEGVAMLNGWGYVQGYETAYEPEGRVQAVLNGAYYLRVEVHLFESAEGAKGAYDFFEDRLRATSTLVTSETIGNESSAWLLVSGTVQGSTVQGAYHRVVSRRGNLVSVVMTWGAAPFMTVDPVLNWSRVVDAKSVGERETQVPTPTSNVNPNQ